MQILFKKTIRGCFPTKQPQRSIQIFTCDFVSDSTNQQHNEQNQVWQQTNADGNGQRNLDPRILLCPCRRLLCLRGCGFRIGQCGKLLGCKDLPAYRTELLHAACNTDLGCCGKCPIALFVRALGNGSGLHLIAKRAGAGNLTLFYARRGKRQYPFAVFVYARLLCLNSRRKKHQYRQQYR